MLVRLVRARAVRQRRDHPGPVRECGAGDPRGRRPLAARVDREPADAADPQRAVLRGVPAAVCGLPPHHPGLAHRRCAATTTGSGPCPRERRDRPLRRHNPYAAACDSWAVERNDDATLPELTSDVPVLAFVGEYDPYTDVSRVRAALAEDAERARHRRPRLRPQRDLGRPGVPGEIRQAFVDDPTAPLLDGCLATTGPGEGGLGGWCGGHPARPSPSSAAAASTSSWTTRPRCRSRRRTAPRRPTSRSGRVGGETVAFLPRHGKGTPTRRT